MVTEKQVWDALAEIPDPEIPVISLVDLGVIRSLDHESSVRTRISGSTPSARRRSAIASRITSRAGQPRNVGVNSTCTRLPST